ncbi:MAG: hypothetical protein QXE31_05585 [Candidatus Woesearchaeota archaeon]
MKKFYFIILMAILFVNPVFALTANVKIIKNSIFMDESALFLINLQNPTDKEILVQVYSNDIAFSSETEPSIIKLMPLSEMNVSLRLSPNSWASYGAKGVSVMISSSEKDNIELSIPIYVKTFDMIERKYSPSVELKVDFTNRVDPRQEYPLTIYLRNRNKLNIESMKVYIRSKNFNYDLEDIKLEPYPNGEFKQTIRYSVDKYTKPQEDMLEIFLVYENKTFNREKYSFRIVDYSDVVLKEEKNTELFKNTIDVYMKNEGNVKSVFNYTFGTNFLRKFFVSSSLPFDKVNLKKDGFFEWSFVLEPLEEKHLRIVENFRPIIYFVLLVLFSVLIYFIYRSPVVVKKEAIITGKNSEGISNMKVLIHIRNRSQDLIEKIEIKDLVPTIAEFIEEERHGTLMPSKVIRNDKKGTVLKWELDALEPFEERLITYRLKSKIVVVGGLTLPNAKIKFEVKGKQRSIKSNKCEVSLSI